MSPDFLPPARCDVPHARKGKRPFQRETLVKGRFPFSRGENRIAQGVENRGSLISVPLALRVFFSGGFLPPNHPFSNPRFLARKSVSVCVANPPTSYRSLSGPPGPRDSPKSLKKKVSRGRRPRGPKKSGKKSRKSPKQTFSRLFPDFSDFFETFSGLLGLPGPEAPGRLLSDFLGISGPEGLTNSCSSREGSQCLCELQTFLRIKFPQK